MPWTPAQNKLFRAKCHNPKIKSGPLRQKACEMASEGIRKVTTAIMRKR